MERTSAGRHRRSSAAKTSPASEVAPLSEPLVEETAPEHDPVVPLATPEPDFSARVPPPVPEAPLPAGRRAVFFDVENTSHSGHIERVIEHLALDRVGRRTEFVAVGNWRVIGPDTARLLARHGAQLVHSAPSAGVKDWSDLRIAVSAGVWLAGARPGDVLEIVSDDRAFDAVGDVAAALGITFHRLTARTLPGAPPAESSRPAPGGDRGRPRGRRGRRGGRRGGAEIEPRRADPVRHPPAPAFAEADEAHSAPHDELVLVVRELADRSPNGAVLVDNVARARE